MNIIEEWNILIAQTVRRLNARVVAPEDECLREMSLALEYLLNNVIVTRNGHIVLKKGANDKNATINNAALMQLSIQSTKTNPNPALME
jgi:hypothetical protein